MAEQGVASQEASEMTLESCECFLYTSYLYEDRRNMLMCGFWAAGSSVMHLMCGGGTDGH